MTEHTEGSEEIRFDDGAAYERYMGRWSQLAGDAFLDWLSPPDGLAWLDVGCGNGAFTEMIAARCAPSAIIGVDPSPEQLAYAAARSTLGEAQFRAGDAMSLPLADDSVNAAVMPLVIFFVPEPAKGVAEMARVVRSGGSISAYAWDMPGGGFPYDVLQREMRNMGASVPKPPSPEASRVDVLAALWTDAGLVDVETTSITVERTFTDFDAYWQTILGGASVGRTLAAMPPAQIASLQDGLLSHFGTARGDSITYTARANAVKGNRASR